jgi:short-subunit dehydrogenase
LAESAAQRGAKVLAVARSANPLQELAEKVRARGETLEVVVGDVTSAADRQHMVEAAVDRFGGADVLINNAGIGATGHFVEANPDHLRQIMEVNFFGAVETTRAFLPLLRQGKQPAIVNISSIAGKRALPARSEYSASKFALQGFSEALRAELSRYAIDVLVVCPGLTQTNFSRNLLAQKARMPLDHLRAMTAERAAALTLRALERGRHETCLTRQGKLMVLVNRLFPRLADRIATRLVQKAFSDDSRAPLQEQELGWHGH